MTPSRTGGVSKNRALPRQQLRRHLPCEEQTSRICPPCDGHKRVLYAIDRAMSSRFVVHCDTTDRLLRPQRRADAVRHHDAGGGHRWQAQRGPLRFADGGGPVHALSAFCHDAGIVLAHEPIAASSDKAEAELAVAPALLARIAWPGRVLTGDALFCLLSLCQQVLAAVGHYLVLVKSNQGTLHGDLQLLCDPPTSVSTAPLTDRRVVRTIESGHGRAWRAAGVDRLQRVLVEPCWLDQHLY